MRGEGEGEAWRNRYGSSEGWEVENGMEINMKVSRPLKESLLARQRKKEIKN